LKSSTLRLGRRAVSRSAEYPFLALNIQLVDSIATDLRGA